MPFARGRTNGPASNAFRSSLKRCKTPGSIHLAGWGRTVGTSRPGAGGRGRRLALFPPTGLLTRHRLVSRWQFYSSFWQDMQSKSYFAMENHSIMSGSSLMAVGSRNGLWDLRSTSRRQGRFRQSLATRGKSCRPKPACFCRRQLPGIGEWQPPVLEFPASIRPTPPGGTNSGSTPLRQSTTRRPDQQPRRNKHCPQSEI
jgi:hypothetical protein